VSSQTTSPAGRRHSKQEEPVDSYPNIPEVRQSHAGNALAMLSVFAILAFGIWAAIGTYTSPADKATAKPQAAATAAPTGAAAAAPAATSTSAATASATPAASGTAPAKAATPGAGGARVHVVGAGDTLYRIAQLYGTTVEAIMDANGFNDRSQVLHVGDKLNIP
jgi:LysM repeat protein